MKALYHILCILAALHLMAACSATGCTDNQNSLPLAGFYSMSTGTAITVDSLAIEGIGAPDDSLLLSPSSRVSSLYLPFRSARNVTSYCFQYRETRLNHPELYDTITFRYDAIPFFASEECGALYHYRVTEYTYTTHLIDSVALLDSLITNVDRETIQIYFRTADPTDPDTPDNPNGGDNPGESDTPTSSPLVGTWRATSATRTAPVSMSALASSNVSPRLGVTAPTHPNSNPNPALK